jgi:hypothetical protein
MLYAMESDNGNNDVVPYIQKSDLSLINDAVDRKLSDNFFEEWEKIGHLCSVMEVLGQDIAYFTGSNGIHAVESADACREKQINLLDRYSEVEEFAQRHFERALGKACHNGDTAYLERIERTLDLIKRGEPLSSNTIDIGNRRREYVFEGFKAVKKAYSPYLPYILHAVSSTSHANNAIQKKHGSKDEL